MKQTKTLYAVGLALLLGWWWSTAVAQSPVQVEAVGLTVSGNHLGFTQGILVRDPDGHVLQLVEP